MPSTRSAGILLHPTSLPGPHGCGDFGDAAFKFVDFLRRSGQSLWQVLPLGPTGYGDSPYASTSSFAGNPVMISLDHLVRDGLLDATAVEPPFFADEKAVDFGHVLYWKGPLLREAADRFSERASPRLQEEFELFQHGQGHWLDDYSLFIALKEHHDAKARDEDVPGAMWNNFWDRDIARRETAAMNRWAETLAEDIRRHRLLQFFFFRQWRAIKSYANENGIKVVGDLPIFVSMDSADVWANPEFFLVDEQCRPTFVAGVPPDYFSETGQLWGNPLYDWDQMKADGFTWWIRRFRGTQDLFDVIRVDHFRGFEACWTIPAGDETAIGGEWVTTPGSLLFKTLTNHIEDLEIIAEDLGLITPEVEALRDEFNFPGMSVLQFAFSPPGDIHNIHRVENHVENSVTYTGTHDNDTTLGWYDQIDAPEREAVHQRLGDNREEIAWGMIRLAMGSAARMAIIPMQDVLGLGGEARMNEPSTLGGNWHWRMTEGYHGDLIEARLAETVEQTQRTAASAAPVR